MKHRRSFVSAGVIAALLALTIAATGSCGGDEATTIPTVPTTVQAEPTTTQAVTASTTSTTGGAAELDMIRAALQTSGYVAEEFEVEDYLIMPQWAGVVISAPMADDVSTLLRRGPSGWEVVAVFSEMTRQELLDYGAPEEIAAFLSYDDPVTPATGVSAESIAYAESLGGTSHEGETLYTVIGASVETEARAQELLQNALPSFGDMQSYFIVQLSDNFMGMEPGWWVVIEAYYAEPDGAQLDFCRRGFPDAYVKRVTVETSNPIPVYEDMTASITMQLLRDAIAQSGSVAVDFEIFDYFISGDWAGVTIISPELEACSVLLYHSGLVGWAVVDLGTGLTEQDLRDQGAPEEIVTFLTCPT